MRFSDICIRLDSLYLAAYIPKKGRFFREPALVARPSGDFAPRFGREAESSFALFPDKFRPSRPFRSGIIIDYPAAEALMRHTLRQAGTVFRPEVTLYLGGCADPVPFARLLRNAGASRVRCVGVCEGAREITGSQLMVDFSERVTLLGKTTGGAVCDYGLDAFSRHIARSFRTAARLAVGYAEALRAFECADQTIALTGRGLDSGLPVSITVSSDERDGMIAPLGRELITLISDLSDRSGVTFSGCPPEALVRLMRQDGFDSGAFISDEALLSRGYTSSRAKVKFDSGG